MNEIHPTAVIGLHARLGNDNKIGPFCVIADEVEIGDDNTFVAHVCIGTPGQFKGRISQGWVQIGNGNTFHEFSQVQRAMGKDARTSVGNNGYFMKGAHIAHDCQIGNGVTMCNDATLGGETVVEDGATLGFQTLVHQQQLIGAYSMLGMGSVVPKHVEVLPGETYAGNPIRHLGRNLVGLERNKVTRDKLKATPRTTESPKKGVRDVMNTLMAYMENRDQSLRPGRYDVVREAIKYLPYLHENDAANLYNMTFSLAWQLHEDFTADQLFIRELIIDAMGKVPPRTSETAKGPIAWLVNHVSIGTYAPYKHVHAYLSGMEPCPIYIHGSVRDREAEQLTDMGHTLYSFKGAPSDVADAIAKQCQEDGVGALISDIYSAIPLLVFQRRAAPLQAYLSPGFQLFPADVVLLPETQEVITHPRHVTEFVPTCVLPEHLCRPKEVKETHVFGVLSRAEKMSESYLKTVGKICDLTGAEFHIYGRGTPCWNHPSFKVMGILNAHEALSNIKVYLDTFPTCGGLSCFEAMAHGIPVVTLDHDSVKSWNIFKPCTKQTEEEFIAAAVRAYKEPRFAAEIATIGRETVAGRITNIPRAVGGLYKALRRHGWQP
jgi:UDP-N-acetylglucosamine acyltransferase